MLGAMRQGWYDAGNLTSNYWGGQVSDSTISSSVMTVADADYIYMAGTVTGGNDYIIKFNNLGVVQWAISASSTMNASSLTQDSTYLYLIGRDTRASSGGTNYYCGRLLQLNKSDGSVANEYQQNLTAQSINNIFSGVASAPNGSITVGQTQGATSTTYEGIVNMTGATTNWTALVYNVDQQSGYGSFYVGTDSSSNNYVLSRSAGVSGNAFPIVTKIDSSGTYQWGRQLSSYGIYAPNSSTSALGCVDLKVDSLGYVYVLIDLGLYGVSHSIGLGLVKYNSSGVVQWQRQINQDHLVGSSLYIDSSDNIYISGFYETSLTQVYNWRPFIAKYDTSGAIQWQRLFTDNTDTTYNDPLTTSITANPSGNIIVSIDGGLNNSGSSLPMTNFKLPPDGSLTGTYTVGTSNWTYATVAYTETTGNLANLTYNQSSKGSFTTTNIVSNASISFSSISGITDNITYIGL